MHRGNDQSRPDTGVSPPKHAGDHQKGDSDIRRMLPSRLMPLRWSGPPIKLAKMDRDAWVRAPRGRVVEIVALSTILTASVLSANRNNRFDERTFTPTPTEAPAEAEELIAVVEPVGEGEHFVRTFDASKFRRGNLHTHTNRSDGDASPLDVYTWYRDHAYGFVAITDHNTFTNPADFGLKSSGFVAVGGEEVTMQGAGRQVHMNALCTDRRIAGGKFQTAKAALLHGVTAIRDAGGVALVNHPNFTWGLKASDLPAAMGAQLLEIYSGHPYVASLGDSTHPSTEEMWDIALSAGLDFTGVAVDDTHHLHRPNRQRASRPGRAWVEVFADSLDEDNICHALRNGLLYASNGPSLRRIRVTEDTYSIWPVDREAAVQFIGKGGKLLAEQKLAPGDASAEYKLAGWEGYVRARIINKQGKMAWTPAVRMKPATDQANVSKVSANEGPP